jgi:hypothetical protein
MTVVHSHRPDDGDDENCITTAIMKGLTNGTDAPRSCMHHFFFKFSVLQPTTASVV